MRLAAGPTEAYRELRRLLQRSYRHSLSEQLEKEATRVAALTRTDDYAAGIEAFHAGSDPEFTGE
jgi:2-(1,2-epoxy-1,2-dihydrophenyl)acetyl-CoA isomerase